MGLIISEFEPHPQLRGVVRRAADYRERSAPLRRLEGPFVGVVLIVSLGPDMEIDGLSPKALARLIRIEHAAQRMREGEPLADVAYSSGYADQPHFNRDFRELVGCAPGEFPFVQDALAEA